MVCNKQLSTGEELYVIDENKFVCKEDYLSSGAIKEVSLNSGNQALTFLGYSGEGLEKRRSPCLRIEKKSINSGGINICDDCNTKNGKMHAEGVEDVNALYRWTLGGLSGEWFHCLPRQDNASLLLCASIHMGRMLVWHQWELTRAQSQ